MTIGIVGRKSGMTRIFTDEGLSIPVTVVEVETNRVSQVKNVETDGYSAVQVTVNHVSPHVFLNQNQAISLRRKLKRVVWLNCLDDR